MAKKLTVELDVETTKAKRKLQEMESSGGQSVAPQVENAAEKMARSMDKASEATQRHAEAAEQSSSNLRQIAKSFGGMAVGMAAQYAAHNMQDGPAKTAIGYGASVAQGASMGAMFGPWGALLGGILGAGKQFISNDAEEKAKAEAAKETSAANRETLATWEAARRQTLAFKESIESLTNAERPLEERQRELAAAIEERTQKDAALKRGLAAEAGIDGDPKNFSRLMRDRQANASELDALKSLAKQLENESKKTDGTAADHTALDALSRIGGGFVGSDSAAAMRNLEQNSKEQLSVLREIRDKKTGGVF